MDLKTLIEKHEGTRLYAYDDATGLPIEKGSVIKGNPTIGVGRLITKGNGISKEEAYILLDNDIQRAKDSLFAALPWVKALDEVRLAVLLNMTFNLGINGLLGFTNTLKAIEGRRFKAASEGMLASKWAAQVKGRAEELARMMETGEWA